MLDIVGFCFGLQQWHSKLYLEHFRPRAYTRPYKDNKGCPILGGEHVLSHEWKRVLMPGALFKAGKWINRLDYLEVNGETSGYCKAKGFTWEDSQ